MSHPSAATCLATLSQVTDTHSCMAVCQHAVICQQLQACSATLQLSLGKQYLAAGFRLNGAEVLQLPQVAHHQCCSNKHQMCSHAVAVMLLAMRLQLNSGATSCLSAAVGVLQSAVVLHMCNATFDSKQIVLACVFGSTASANSLSQITSLLWQPAVLCKAASAEV